MSLKNYPDFLLNFSEQVVNGEDEHFYRFKSFRLEVGERRLLKNGFEIPLTPKAFDVLVLLVKRVDHLVEKDDLLKIIWPGSFVEESNIARIVHILRKALGEDRNGNKFIETVAKKGYRFVARVEKVENDVRPEIDGDHSLINQKRPPSSNSFALNSLAFKPPNNLLNNRPPIIGRESDLTEIENRLQRSDLRLITITGAGGSGKTLLAQTVASDSLLEFTDGVYFIDLSTIETSDLILPVISQTLGVCETGGESLEANVITFLRSRKILIVLDNFEQILDAASYVSELLSKTQNLKLIVTSRVRLNLRFEHEFVLHPLKIPRRGIQSPDELKKYPSVDLFVKSAKKVKRDFDLTENNAEPVAEICRRLDGLPLAIELAAARIKLLSPELLLARLKYNLELLSGGARDLPERQQTMSRAIGWSYNLLDAEEKKFLSRLAVFAGGFTPLGAEAVGNAEGDLKADTLSAVSLLLDKNFLVRDEQYEGDPRFRMLTVVRDFLLEKLADSGDINKYRKYHADFFTAFAETAAPELNFLKNESLWLDKLEQEIENLRAAIGWLIEVEPRSALQIVSAICSFWGKRGFVPEGIEWMKKTLEKNDENSDPVFYAKVCRSVGNLCGRAGDFQAGELFLEKSLLLSSRLGHQPMIGDAKRGLGGLKFLQRDFKSARKLLNESLAIARKLKDTSRITQTLNNLGVVVCEEEDYLAAENYYQEAYETADRESLRPLIPYCLTNLASIAFLLKNYRSSHALFLEALQLSVELRNRRIIFESLDALAALAVKNGEMLRAAQLWGAAQSVYEQTGEKIERFERDFKYRYRHRFSGDAEKTIGFENFNSAIEAGRSMDIINAAALACQTYSCDGIAIQRNNPSHFSARQ